MTGYDAVRAVAPSPGVERTRKTLADAAQILAPHLTRGTITSAITDSVYPSGPLLRLRYGVYTTRARHS